MEGINAFEYSKLKLMNEKPSKVISWITILSIFTFLILFISLFLHFNVYSRYTGYIDINDDYNLRVIVDKNIFPIKDKYTLYIENKKYDYKIVSIVYHNQYYELLIDCKMDKKLLINNNIVTVKFKKYKTTLMKEFIKKIKKGMI